LDLIIQLPLLHLILGLCGVSRNQGVTVVRKIIAQRVGTVAAQHIARLVERNLAQPGGKRAFPAKHVELPVGGEERFLTDVLAGLVIAEKAVQHVKHLALVAQNQDFVRL